MIINIWPIFRLRPWTTNFPFTTKAKASLFLFVSRSPILSARKPIITIGPVSKYNCSFRHSIFIAFFRFISTKYMFHKRISSVNNLSCSAFRLVSKQLNNKIHLRDTAIIFQIVWIFFFYSLDLMESFVWKIMQFYVVLIKIGAVKWGTMILFRWTFFFYFRILLDPRKWDFLRVNMCIDWIMVRYFNSVYSIRTIISSLCHRWFHLLLFSNNVLLGVSKVLLSPYI